MKIVATSGIFDLIHGGHIVLFSEMRKLAGPDGLVVVLLNDDSYIKGPNRPLLPMEERLSILRAMRDIDIVIPFKSFLPCNMISFIEPTFWVKGDEYLYNETYKGILPETPIVELCGGKVILINSGITTHSSDIINRIRGN